MNHGHSVIFNQHTTWDWGHRNFVVYIDQAEGEVYIDNKISITEVESSISPSDHGSYVIYFSVGADF